MVSATTLTIDATEHPIAAVTVFRSNAEVTRKFSVKLKTGQNDIEIISLPSVLDNKTIRVQGFGQGVKVVDVVSRPVKPVSRRHWTMNSNLGSTQVTELRSKKKVAEGKVKVLQSQAEILYNYGKSIRAQDVDPLSLVKFLQTYDQTAVEQQESEISKIQDQIDKELESPDSSDDQASERRATVSVVVQSLKDATAELTLIYLVPKARWDPSYELRATTDPNGQVSKTVTLHYRASISQSTGEEWKNTTITLSTAEPDQGLGIPAHKPLKIKPKSSVSAYLVEEPRSVAPAGLGRPFFTGAAPFIPPQPQAFIPAAQTGGLFGTTAPQQTTYIPPLYQQPQQQQQTGATQQTGAFGASGSTFGLGLQTTIAPFTTSGTPQPPVVEVQPMLQSDPPNVSHRDRHHHHHVRKDTNAPFDYAVAITAANALAASYKIDGKSSIPSDSATHKVAISVSKELEAETAVVTLPRARPTAFLQAVIVNTTSEPLLPGSVAVFFDESYVSATSIELVGPQETFTCSLGAESNLRVLFSHTVDKATTSSFAFAANASSTPCSNTVTVKSSKGTLIPKIIIRDSVPTAKDPFKVILTSPAGLAKLEKDGETVQEAPGVVARWSKGEASRDSGLMEWVVTDLGAREERKVTLSWVVESPQGVEWSHSM